LVSKEVKSAWGYLNKDFDNNCIWIVLYILAQGCRSTVTSAHRLNSDRTPEGRRTFVSRYQLSAATSTVCYLVAHLVENFDFQKKNLSNSLVLRGGFRAGPVKLLR
jgi:hypothetical protein